METKALNMEKMKFFHFFFKSMQCPLKTVIFSMLRAFVILATIFLERWGTPLHNKVVSIHGGY